MMLNGIHLANEKIIATAGVTGMSTALVFPEVAEEAAALWGAGRYVVSQVIRYGVVGAARANPLGTYVLATVATEAVACGMSGLPICPQSSLPTRLPTAVRGGSAELQTAVRTEQAIANDVPLGT